MISLERIDNSTRLIDLTVGEFRSLISSAIPPAKEEPPKEKKLVYGYDGIAGLLKCSRTAVYRLKSSGKIDSAIMQDGRKIIADAEKLLDIMKLKKR